MTSPLRDFIFIPFPSSVKWEIENRLLEELKNVNQKSENDSWHFNIVQNLVTAFTAAVTSTVIASAKFAVGGGDCDSFTLENDFCVN